MRLLTRTIYSQRGPLELHASSPSLMTVGVGGMDMGVCRRVRKMVAIVSTVPCVSSENTLWLQ